MCVLVLTEHPCVGVGFVCLRSPPHGVLPPFASPAGVAVLGCYAWAVICSHVCALTNEKTAPRLCVCVSPTTITPLGCVICVLIFAFASRHSLALSPLPSTPSMTHQTMLKAPPRWCVDPRLTCSTWLPLDAELHHKVSSVYPSRHTVDVFLLC